MNNQNYSIVRGKSRIGLSKIGGIPDLPIDVSYPTRDNKFYKFIAQLNFEELNIDTELVKKGSFLSLFTGSIYNSDIEYFYFDQIPKDLENRAVPEHLHYLGDTDYSAANSGKIMYHEDINLTTDEALHILGESISYRDPVFMKLIGFPELETNVLFDYSNSFQVVYFGQLSGRCNVEQLLSSQEECFQLGGLTYDQWKSRLLLFKSKELHYQAKYKDLLCLMSIPSASDIGMIWGDMGRIEFFIMKEDLIEKKFNNMIVKYAPD